MCEEVKGVRVFAERTEHPEATVAFPNPLLALSDAEIITTINHLSGLFVISNPLREYYENLGIDPSKIHVLNMTVDVERFKNIKKAACREKYIAYCGNVSNNKDGVDILIKSFALVCKKRPDIKLFIIGKTPSQTEASDNLRLIKSLGIEERIVFTGVVSSEQMPQLLKDAVVLALARPDNLQAKYGFPTKLGEYLLTENPVVVTSVGDIPLFLKDGVSALISEPSNVEMFADKLLWALDNPKEATAIGKAGANVAIENFNSDIETKKLLSIIGVC
jgi:glycosyltransferase involved in cell wall biosynthesis